LIQLVTTLTSAGVVPVLSTIPDSQLDGGILRVAVRQFNQVIADVAGQYRVPLWNLFRALETLPGEALRPDGVHLNASPNGGGAFSPGDLQFGQNLRNLEALDVLDWFRKGVLGPPALPAVPAWTTLPSGRPAVAVGGDAGQGAGG